MKLLIKEILKNKEVAALPGLLESGGLPALISGLSPVHRANLAAALQLETERPLFVLCPDDSSAESMARDLAAMLGEEPRLLLMRDYAFHPTEAASHHIEQKRISALFALLKGECGICVASVSGLMQRTLPPSTLDEAALDISAGDSIPMERIEHSLSLCGYVKAQQVEGDRKSVV